MNNKPLSSPFVRQRLPLDRVMLHVVLAGIPGAVLMAVFFGWGIIINLLIAITFAYLAEAAVLKIRNKPIKATLQDNTALVTACLYALALPSLLPWWMTALGVIFAITVVKQLYGGVGFNIFNPAMAGYVVLLISFPSEMTLNWHNPIGMGAQTLSLWETLHIIFTESLSNGQTLVALHGTIDAISQATPLDTLKTGLTNNMMASEVMQAPLFGQFGGLGWEWINLAFFIGGLYLVMRGIADWRIPLSFIVVLFTTAMLLNSIDGSRFINPMFHIVTGGTMLGAFFIATDPVSASTTRLGRFVYGGLIGLLVYIIRTWGAYPDGIAFAVLILNMAVPTIDHYTRPRTYGHNLSQNSGG